MVCERCFKEYRFIELPTCLECSVYVGECCTPSGVETRMIDGYYYTTCVECWEPVEIEDVED
jgi:hypothetical protein